MKGLSWVGTGQRLRAVGEGTNGLDPGVIRWRGWWGGSQQPEPLFQHQLPGPQLKGNSPDVSSHFWPLSGLGSYWRKRELKPETCRKLPLLVQVLWATFWTIFTFKPISVLRFATGMAGRTQSLIRSLPGGAPLPIPPIPPCKSAPEQGASNVPRPQITGMWYWLVPMLCSDE